MTRLRGRSRCAVRSPVARLRGGSTLVELIAVLPILVAIGVISASLFHSMVLDVPRLQRLSNENGQVCRMLERLQRDVDAARALPKAAADRAAGQRLLLLQMTDRVVCYRLAEGRGLRERLSPGAADQPPAWRETESWSLPNARVTFRRREDSPGIAAVEVRTAIEYQAQTGTQSKLAGTRVFFLSALPGRRVER